MHYVLKLASGGGGRNERRELRHRKLFVERLSFKPHDLRIMTSKVRDCLKKLRWGLSIWVSHASGTSMWICLWKEQCEKSTASFPSFLCPFPSSLSLLRDLCMPRELYYICTMHENRASVEIIMHSSSREIFKETWEPRKKWLHLDFFQISLLETVKRLITRPPMARVIFCRSLISFSFMLFSTP